MSRNRFFGLALVALFLFAVSGCKSNNTTTPSSSSSSGGLLVK